MDNQPITENWILTIRHYTQALVMGHKTPRYKVLIAHKINTKINYPDSIMIPKSELFQINSSFIGTKMYDIVPTEIKKLGNGKESNNETI